MFTNRLFVLSVVLALVAIAVFSARATVVTGADGTFSETKDEALRESQLGDRYGELPVYSDGFSPEQIQREYQRGERYGEIPSDVAQFSAEQILREYGLGERYGVTPQKYDINAADQSASDFHQRHPEWTWVIRDASAVIPVTGDSAYPDYYQRHPELMAPVRSIDLTDYYFRHPGL